MGQLAEELIQQLTPPWRPEQYKFCDQIKEICEIALFRVATIESFTYIVGRDKKSLLFQYIVSILWVLLIFTRDVSVYFEMLFNINLILILPIRCKESEFVYNEEQLKFY